MEISKTLYVTTRSDWRKWLDKNYKNAPEIWLVFYKKETERARISYNDAVEEALCFGWIDSIVKSYNRESFVQRFSPRKAKTAYSQTNKERLKKLIRQKRVVKEVLASLDNIELEKFKIPPDILKAIKSDKEAWKNFQGFSKQYIRIRVGFVEGARRRPAEFKKRLNYFIKKTSQNKKFGYGGIEEYF